MEETKEQKFKRIAEARTNKIIDMIKLLGNLSVKSNYSYTSADVGKIFNAIEQEIGNARKRFEKAESPGRSTFKLR